MTTLYFLAVLVLVACESKPFIPLCERDNVIRGEPDPEPVGPPIDGLALLDYLVAALRTKNIVMYEELIAPDFVFVDETIPTRLINGQREVELVRRVFDHYAHIEVQLEVQRDDTLGQLSPEGKGRGCQSFCGRISMSLFPANETAISINEEICLTSCPQSQDLWHLIRWEVLRSMPIENDGHNQIESWATVKEKGMAYLGQSDTEAGYYDDEP